MADLLALSSRIIDTDTPGADMNRVNQELSDVADGVAIIESFSNIVVFKTDAGLALIDTSLPVTIRGCLKSLRGWSDDPVAGVFYTHGHQDHVGGGRALLEEAETRGDARPRIYGHENVRPRFERYAATSGYNKAINARQFGLELPEKRKFLDPRTPLPEVTFRDRMSANVGGMLVEMRHAKGETDDHFWGWVPQHRALITGDFLLPMFANAGNPQKQQRYPLEWAAALREMAGMGAELLLPAHGLPIGGNARITKVLDRVATALEYLVRETLALMNQGATLDTILHSVRIPDDQLKLPYLTPTYDEPEFVLHNIWRLYGGWYDGNPATLKPAPQSALAAEFAKLAGGVPALVARAKELSESGEHRLACHLVETAVQAAPQDLSAHGARAEIYGSRREAESSLMAKGVFAHAVRESEAIAGADGEAAS